MKIKHLSILCAVFIGLLITSCPEPVQPEVQATSFVINVFDDLGEALPSNVQIFIYDDENEYLEDKDLGTFTQGIPYLTDSIGSVTISDKIDHQNDYYLIIVYRDRSRFVDLDNFDADYRIPDEYIFESTDTYFNVNLKQSKSAISFYIEDFPEEQFPVSILLDGDTIGELTINSEGIPNLPFEDNTISYKLSKSGQWTAISSLGCFWYGDISVGGTQTFTPIGLGECATGGVTFYSNDTTDIYPLKVILNNNDDVGFIEEQGTPQSCFDGSYGLSVSREPGEYSYTISSKDGACQLSGSVLFTLDSCTMVELPKCELP